MSQPQGYFHEDEILGKAYDRTLTRRLIGYLGPYRGLTILSFFLLLLLSASQIAPPIIAKFIVDSAITPAVNGEVTPDVATGRLAVFGLAYLGVLLAAAGLRYWQSLLATWIGQRAMYDLRLELFRHLQFLSLGFFDRNPVGRLMTRITNDIDALIDMVQRGVVAIFGDVFMLVGVSATMLVLDWRLALVTFASLPVILGLTAYFRGMMRDSFRSIRIRLARVNAYLNEDLSGVSIVQLFTREDKALKSFDLLNADLLRANQGAVRAQSIFMPTVNFTRAGTSAALFIAAKRKARTPALMASSFSATWTRRKSARSSSASKAAASSPTTCARSTMSATARKPSSPSSSPSNRPPPP